MNYKRRMKIGAFLGLVTAAIVGSAITDDKITGVALLLYPAGLIVGLLLAHVSAMRTIRRQHDPPPTPHDVYQSTRDR